MFVYSLNNDYTYRTCRFHKLHHPRHFPGNFIFQNIKAKSLKILYKKKSHFISEVHINENLFNLLKIKYL